MVSFASSSCALASASSVSASAFLSFSSSSASEISALPSDVRRSKRALTEAVAAASTVSENVSM